VFYWETAKILSPEKTVLVLDENATCSLDEDCQIEEFSKFCDQHPDRKVVVYANTSAAVKARADWVVTSGSYQNPTRLFLVPNLANHHSHSSALLIRRFFVLIGVLFGFELISFHYFKVLSDFF
jgi:hypothetical protein